MRTRLLPALSAVAALAALSLAPAAAAAPPPPLRPRLRPARRGSLLPDRVRRGARAELRRRPARRRRHPATGRQRLIDRGVVRLRSARTVSFRLNGNGWRFGAGRRVRVEILGRDVPTYRPSNGAFRVDVSRLRVTLPARERRPR